MAPKSELPQTKQPIPFKTYNIGLSVGGTKIAGAAVFADGSTASRQSFNWREQLGAQASVDDFLAGIEKIVQKIKSAFPDKKCLKVGLAFPGPGEYEQGFFSPMNIPLPDRFPIKKVLEEKLNLPVETVHDGAASVLGETGPKGTLPGYDDAMVVIIGTGIGGGVKRNGKHDYGKNSLGELGYSLWYEKPENEIDEEEIFYLYIGEQTYSKFMERIEILSGNGHKPVEKRLAGPALAIRFVVYTVMELNVEESSRFFGESVVELLTQLHNGDAQAEKRVLSKITEGAKAEYYGCYKFIQDMGIELGIALASYVAHHIDEKFVRHIVLVSGVGENFGKGVFNDDGEDLWLNSIRKGLIQTLVLFGQTKETAEQIASGIVRSKMTHEREILAFIPNTKNKPAMEITLQNSL